MRAAVARRIDATDPLAVLDLVDDWPEPDPPEGHTLVTVAATTVNMHDHLSMLGVGVRPEQFPMVLGCDIVGFDPAGNEVIVSGAFADPDAGAAQNATRLVKPPSTTMFSPVTHDAAGLARKATTLATSAAVPRRCDGWAAMAPSYMAGTAVLILSQPPPSTKIGPGDTQLARMPVPPNAWA